MKQRLGLAIASVLLTCSASGCQVRDCDDTRARAQELRDDAQTCASGQTCMLVDFYELAGANNCLAPFQCTQAVRDDVNVDALGRRARDLADDYQHCDECASASCQDPAALEAVCNTVTRRCEARSK